MRRRNIVLEGENSLLNGPEHHRSLAVISPVTKRHGRKAALPKPAGKTATTRLGRANGRMRWRQTFDHGGAAQRFGVQRSGQIGLAADAQDAGKTTGAVGGEDGGDGNPASRIQQASPLRDDPSHDALNGGLSLSLARRLPRKRARTSATRNVRAILMSVSVLAVRLGGILARVSIARHRGG